MSSWLSSNKTDRIIKKTQGLCGYCGCVVDSKNFSIDHIVPKNKSGTNSEDNLILSCLSCNCRKGAKTLSDFRLSEQWRHIYLEVGLSINQIRWVINNTDLAERSPRPAKVFHFELSEASNNES
jgi:hypothetical protein